MWQCTPPNRSAGLSTTRPRGFERHAVVRGEAELRVERAGLDELVRVRLDAGRDPHEHRGLRGACGRQELEPVELVERVGDNAADAGVERGGQLGGRLVVAVEDDPFGRKAGMQRDVELAAGRDVEVEALLGRQAGHRDAQERLARVRHVARAEGADVLAAAASEIVLVVDEERRAELGRQLLEHTGVLERGRDERSVERAHRSCSSSSWSSSRAISSGAETPSSPSASARPIRHASDSQRRAWVSVSSSLITRQSR